MVKKLFYRIGEACNKLDIQPYVLRYWETEFDALAPRKSKSGQRVYSEEELELIKRIKELLYEEGYTIAGAKKRLETEIDNGGSGSTSVLDSGIPHRIETLERGVSEALEKAKAVLDLLE